MSASIFIKGHEIIVDDIDSDLFKQAWHLIKKKGSKGLYVKHTTWTNGKVGVIYLHRVIASRVLGRDLTRNDLIDHEDVNPLNNQRHNLRLATHSQNHANTPRNVNNKVGLKGVSKLGNKYRATIMVNYKQHHLGLFATPEEAHAAYLAKAKELYGEFARGE